MSLGTVELAAMRSDVEETLLDTCQIGTEAEASGLEPGADSWTYDDESPVSCGFNASASKEVFDGSQATITDAVFRLPIGTAVTSVNRLKLTHRQGVALDTAEEYALIGAPRRGLTALTVYGRRVVGSSTG